ncbi:hypothetical protein R6Q59_024762 [Mikania micrantha]
MSSFAERLRVRSVLRPRYSLDESDDDLDLLLKESKKSETIEKIARDDAVNPLNDIEKILDCKMRPPVADDSDASKLGSKQIFVKQYLVKWKGLSYLHCTWVPEKEFIKAYKELPRLRTKVNNFCKRMPVGNNSEDDFVPIRPEYTMVDRILACRQHDDEKEYLVKWVGLGYDECYWESESDVSSFQQQIENFNRLQSRYRKLRKQKSNIW